MECKNPLYCSSSVVVELQSKFFRIQPRGKLTSTELRNAGILPAAPPMSRPGSPSAKEKAAQLKLKEPRDLYSTATLLHPIKWPVECQVISEKIKHVDAGPGKMEPFYQGSGKEPQPQPVGVEMGTVVYDYQPKLSVDYFCRATIGGSQDLQEFDNEPNSLKFESRFESGNLAKAIKVTNMYYELYLRPDLYTDRHAQWFYFRIQNIKENVTYRFSIVNFNKPDSLYRYGLKILMYSEKEAQLNNIGWTRCGQNIAYFKNDISPDENGPYYTLTFNVKFRHNNDTIYLAQCYPYTYATLQNYLKGIEDDEFKSQLLTIRLLCRSLAGNNVHILTVTSPDNHQEENSKKPVIVISARVHPGETQSSYMMKGIIDFLTSDCSQAKELRDRFIFKLVPMLNPDGVIVGNSRCCLLGQDLNRQYRTVLREAFPQIYHVKVMLRRLQEENGIFLYCDLHGHSRKNNVFIYGCENRRIPERRLLEQVFPLMMHKNAADKFSFQNCKFKIQKNKEGTGRIFVWTLGVVNSYTLEISLGGSTMPSRQHTHFNTADYEACGRHFCETLLDYSDSNPLKENLRERILQKLLDGGSTADEPKNVILSDYSSLSHSETEDDDSGDEADGEDRHLPVSTLTVPNITGSPGGSTSIKLKRQSTLRKHLSHQYRNKLSSSGKSQTQPPATVLLAQAPTTNPVGSTKQSDKSSLTVHKTSVDFTKIKQRKLEESIIITPSEPVTSHLENDNSTTLSYLKDTKDKEMSAAYRRLSKFRRKSRRTQNSSVLDQVDTPSHHSHHHYQLAAKCTRILFDDPFNPPGSSWKTTPTRRSQLMIGGIGGNFLDEGDGGEQLVQSGTEDECDPYDMTIKNQNYLFGSVSGGFKKPVIKVTDCDQPQNNSSGLCGVTNDDFTSLSTDMSRLQIKQLSRNNSSKSDSESNCPLPSFTPFVPSFPVGKAFLHQTFYPDLATAVTVNKREPSSPGASGKMKTSLSDTTIAGAGVSIGNNSNTGHLLKPVARRSSISYLVCSGGGNNASTMAATMTKNKLQATGSTIIGSNTGIVGGNSKRRVSWTGTLTVSVPTAIPTQTGPNGNSRGSSQPVMMNNTCQKKKSFRKSKSLNDTKHQTSMEDNSTSFIGTSASLDKLDRVVPSGISNGKVSATKVCNASLSVSAPVIPGAASGATCGLASKKRRAKLKRTKLKSGT